MMSGSSPKCSWQKNLPVRPSPVCTSSETNRVRCRRHSSWTPDQYGGVGAVDALALDRFDDERRHVAGPQLRLERVEVAEGHHRAAGEQRTEALLELLAPVEREGAGRQPVEGVLGVQDPRPPGGVPGELDRGLDRLGSGVAKEHPADPRVATGTPAPRPGARAGARNPSAPCWAGRDPGPDARAPLTPGWLRPSA